jgi:hypothetical protein
MPLNAPNMTEESKDTPKVGNDVRRVIEVGIPARIKSADGQQIFVVLFLTAVMCAAPLFVSSFIADMVEGPEESPVTPAVIDAELVSRPSSRERHLDTAERPETQQTENVRGEAPRASASEPSLYEKALEIELEEQRKKRLKG